MDLPYNFENMDDAKITAHHAWMTSFINFAGVSYFMLLRLIKT